MELSADGQELRIEIGEGWMQADRSRVQQDRREEITLVRLPDDRGGFARFAAREGDLVHLLVVPIDASGTPLLVLPPDPNAMEDSVDELSYYAPCPWQRLTAGSEPIERGLRSIRRVSPNFVAKVSAERLQGRLVLHEIIEAAPVVQEQ